MKLIGWHKPVSHELEQAIKKGFVTIHYDKKHNFDYLKGSYVNKHGVIVEFQ